jgi:hypothetical protein
MNIMKVGHWCDLTFSKTAFILFLYHFLLRTVSVLHALNHVKSTGEKSSSMKTSKEGIVYEDRVEIMLWRIRLQKLKSVDDNGGSDGVVNLVSCNIDWIHILIFHILYFKLFSLDINHKLPTAIHSYLVHHLQWSYKG